MSYRHDELEQLCALAAIGQISEHGAMALEAHVLTCADCRQRMVEMEQASFEWFVLFASRTKRASLPAGMADRFAVRALHHGVPLPGRVSLFSPNRLATVFAAVLLVVFLAKTTGNYRSQLVEQRPDISVKVARVEAVTTNAPVAKWKAEASSNRVRLHRVKRKSLEAVAPQQPVVVTLGSVRRVSYPDLSLQFSMAHGFNASTVTGSFAAARLSEDHYGLRIGMRPFDPATVPLLWRAREDAQPPTRPFHFEALSVMLPLPTASVRLMVPQRWDVDRTRMNLPSGTTRAW